MTLSQSQIYATTYTYTDWLKKQSLVIITYTTMVNTNHNNIIRCIVNLKTVKEFSVLSHYSSLKDMIAKYHKCKVQ